MTQLKFQFPDGNYFYLDPDSNLTKNLAPSKFQFPDGNYFYLDLACQPLVFFIFLEVSIP